ncbi:DUF6624 domain-containing protein [Mucilaginibacter ximonensis]|uniref:DUF6624 domain-containing protein n=1 Tax=Mucilaginibacter ximonensis TaxID=538021 RepID=A0ABW5YFU9_9SPHI
MKKILFISGCLFINSSFAQSKINLKLKAQLDTILQTDQGVREFFDTETSEKRKDTLALILGYPKDTLKKIGMFGAMYRIDPGNVAKVEHIIMQYGYPGKSMVGEPANEAVFYVIQHSNKIEKYYPLIEEAGKKGELPFTDVALMLDRKLCNENKEQMYGSQIHFIQITDAKTGKKRMFGYVVPIADASNVNKRREEAGFNLTVEANARRLGAVYKPYTYEQIDLIKQGKLMADD